MLPRSLGKTRAERYIVTNVINARDKAFQLDRRLIRRQLHVSRMLGQVPALEKAKWHLCRSGSGEHRQPAIRRRYSGEFGYTGPELNREKFTLTLAVLVRGVHLTLLVTKDCESTVWRKKTWLEVLGAKL
jgi:hypothetical protein